MGQKKERIILAAQDVFLANGIEKTKVSDIVKTAGVAQGTFYLYFPTKYSIMPEIAKLLLQDVLTYLKEHTDNNASYETQLMQTVEAILTFNAQHKDRQKLLYAGLAQGEYIGQWEEIYEPFYRQMTHLIEKGLEQGQFKTTLNPSNAARIVIGTMESTAEQLYLFNEQVSDAFVQEQTVALKQFIKNALGIYE